MTDLPIRYREADRLRGVQQSLSSLGGGGGPVGVSDGAFEVEIDDVVRMRWGLLEDGLVGIRFYDENGLVKRTITEGLG